MSERSLLMLPLANLMPPLPGLSGLAGSFKTYAPSPVWGSGLKPSEFLKARKINEIGQSSAAHQGVAADLVPAAAASGG
jgi:hypothetical protein